VTGWAPGVSALMLLVIVTVQVVVCAASFPEPLHWVTLVTRSFELVTKVPLPESHGSPAHKRSTVTDELVVPPLMVFTTVTVHTMAVVAPPGPALRLLHWSIATFAACAGEGVSPIPTIDMAPTRASTAIKANRRLRSRVGVGEMASDVAFMRPRFLAAASATRKGARAKAKH